MRASYIASCSAFFVFSAAASAQPCLRVGDAHVVEITAGDAPTSAYTFECADFTSDGLVDVAVPIYAPGIGSFLRIYPGDGAGGLGAPIDTPSVHLWFSQTAVTGDFNSDGHADVCVSTARNSRLLPKDGPAIPPAALLYLGDGAGGFSEHVLEDGWHGTWSAAGDFNGDGTLDFESGDGHPPFSRRLLITFDEKGTPSTEWRQDNQAFDSAAADLDEDGVDDRVHVSGGAVVVYWSRPDGAHDRLFIDPPDPDETLTAGATGDFDGDGRIDLMVGSSNGRVFSYRSIGSRAFADPVEHATASTFALPLDSAFRMTTADLDLDDLPDLLITDTGGRRLVAMLNRSRPGAIALSGASTLTDIGVYDRVCTGVNLDGRAGDEMLVVDTALFDSGGRSRLVVLPNTSRRVGDCEGDISGDGRTTMLDLALLLAAWGESNEFDIDGDGIVDGCDLAILLADYGG